MASAAEPSIEPAAHNLSSQALCLQVSERSTVKKDFVQKIYDSAEKTLKRQLWANKNGIGVCIHLNERE